MCLKKCGGASSQPLKTIIQQSLEGLVEIYKNGKMLELQGSSCNSENGTGWRRLKMLDLMSIYPQMDLPSERLILSLKISPSNQHCKAPQQMLTRNNAVTEENCAVGARECVGPMPRSAISSKGFQNNLSKVRETPPLKNK